MFSLKKMVRLIPLILVFFLLSSSPVFGVAKFVPFNDLTGGQSGDLDNIECEDASGDGGATSDPLEDGDVAIGVVHTGGTAGQIYFYTYDGDNNNTTNPENSPYVVEPDDVFDDCSDTGAWILVKELYMDRSTAPRIILRDSDATDFDQNGKIVLNCTDTGSGTEDCDIYFCAQEAGSDISADPCGTWKIHIDADGNIIFGDVIQTTTIEVGHASDTTISRSAAGKIAVEGEVLSGAEVMSFAILAPAATMEPHLVKVREALTITDIHCIVEAATSAVIDIQECDSAGANCATVDATITCDTNGVEDDGSLSNGTIDAGDWIKVDIGTVTGTVETVTISVYYDFD